MTEQETKTDASSVVEQPKEEVKLSSEQPKDAKKIAVDLGGGVTVELDIEQGKKYIAYRDSRTKGFKELETKLKSAEEAVKAEATRAQLMEAIKNQNIEQVEEQVSAKYKDTISKFEKKVFEGEIKATLSQLGVISDAISDATKLVLSEAKVELDGDDIKLNGIKVQEYLKEWTSKKPHLVGVKASDKKLPLKPGQPQKDKIAPSISKGLEKFLK